MRFGVSALLCLLVVAAQAIPESRPLGFGRELKSSCSPYVGYDWNGANYKVIRGIDGVDKCCHACYHAGANCVGYVWKKYDDVCWLKKYVTSKYECKDCYYEKIH